MRLLIFLIVFSCLLIPGANAQKDSMTKAADNFKTGRSNITWMGANYRQEWNTPITVPVLDLTGLTPVKRGGGKQTKSLRLEAADGKEYMLRSIQKFITEKTLPGDLRSEAAADLVSEGVSASYPYAALSVQPLADAAGVPYGKVRLVYVPDDPRLGEHRADFGNMLASFEERMPANVKKIWDTEEVIEKLEEDNDNEVDQKALLRARILDMFIMDFDRHEGQWNWGAIDKDKGKTYFPIPKDRDQAFYVNQGILPGFAKGRSLVPQLEGFKVEANSISRFNFAARNFDRYFLNELTEEDWKSAADKFVSQMTDEVIDRGIAMQPREIRDMHGSQIAQTLKERRKFIVEEVMEYYRFLAHTVSVTGSDKKELVKLDRSDDGTVKLEMYKIDKDGNQSSKMYERSFNPLLTKEIRVYGMDGDDKFQVNGSSDKIKTRIIGGGGQDVFESNAKRSGPLVYDRLDGRNTVSGHFQNRFSNDTMVNKFDWLGYKYPYQSVFATIGYNPDDGILLGPTFKYIRHGFRKDPYKTFHHLKVAYAFATKAIFANYHGEFISVLGDNTDIIADLDYRGPNGTANFFGYGMNSIFNKNAPGGFRFYRVRYDFGDFAVQLRQRLSKSLTIGLGPVYQMYHIDSSDEFNKVRNVFVNNAALGLDPNTFTRRQSYAGGKFSLQLKTMDHEVLPESGINWITTIRKLKGLRTPSYDNVTQINSDFAFYWSLIPDRLTFADRIGVGTTLGDGFEFFHAQYLGLEDNLRGYRKQRFAGKTKFYNQAELRLRVANFNTYLFPGALGLLGFVDAGRVWVEEDVDRDFALGYGIGFWFAPLRKINFTFTWAMSDEGGMPLVGMGFKF